VFKAVAVYFSANLIAQLITLLSYPIITRVYTPYELGLASPIIMGLAMFMSFSSLNLPYYAMTLSLKKERCEAFAASMQVTFILLPIILLLSLLYFLSVKQYEADFLPLLFVVMLSFVGSSLLLTFERFLQFYSNFNTISVSLILAAIVGFISKLAFAYFEIGYWGLLNAFLLGLLVQIVVCLSVCFIKEDFKPIFRFISKTRLLYFVGQFQFTFYRTSQAFVWFVATVATSSLVLVLYGEGAAGVFSLAWLMSSAVANILGKALFDIYFSNIAKLSTSDFIKQSNEYWGKLTRIFPVLVLISPIAYFIAGPLFSTVFGKEWSESGYIGVVLLCSFGFGSILTPVFITYIKLAKQHVQLFFSLLTFLLPLIAIYFCYVIGLPLIYAILGYGFVNIILLCISAYYCHKLVLKGYIGGHHVKN